MEWTFLGTSCMVPTKDRNVTAHFLSFKNHGLLFDCGEGTQRQMNIAGIKRTAVTKIFISHWHGDHVAGLPGLLQTLSADPHKIQLFGPPETEKRMNAIFEAFFFGNENVNIEIIELNPEDVTKIFENEDFEIYAAPLEHSTPVLGYRFVEKDKFNIDMKKLKALNVPSGPHLKALSNNQDSEYKGATLLAKDLVSTKKGKVVSYIADTRPCKGAVDLSNNADLLVTEAVYIEQHQDRAEQYFHMTAKEAANFANLANVKKLYLTHFSQRYKQLAEIQEEAESIFPGVVCAHDFLKIKI